MAVEVNAELTAWSNVRLAASGMCCEDIVTGIMEGEVMKVFTESKFPVWDFLVQYTCLYMCHVLIT